MSPFHAKSPESTAFAEVLPTEKYLISVVRSPNFLFIALQSIIFVPISSLTSRVMRQLVFTVTRSRINALVLQIGQVKEHHPRQPAL